MIFQFFKNKNKINVNNVNSVNHNLYISNNKHFNSLHSIYIIYTPLYPALVQNVTRQCK